MEDELRALLEKLNELVALRELGDEDPPADRLRALAARFPGALRELDRTPLETLEARIEELTLALVRGEAPAWALVTSRFHGWLRVALRLRRDAKRTEEAALAWASSYVAVEPGDPSRERLTVDVLRVLLAPPEGRLVRVAIALTAEDSGLSEDAVERWVHGD